MGSQICLSGIHNIWRWRWVGGNKEKACYGNKQAVAVEILVEWSGSLSKTKNSQNMCFRLSYIYGCETWTLGKTTLQRINAFEMKCYRKFFKILWLENRTNKSAF